MDKDCLDYYEPDKFEEWWNDDVADDNCNDEDDQYSLT